jgi:hypothetical protein
MLKGKIILQVESNGEAYYISPVTKKMYFLSRPETAFEIMREQGIGIKKSELEKIEIGSFNVSGIDIDNDGLSDSFEDAIGTDKNKDDTDGDGYKDKDEIKAGYSPIIKNQKYKFDIIFAGEQKGKTFLQVEQKGEAWYINPNDRKRYFLGRPTDAFKIMKDLGLGISNKDFKNIQGDDIAEIKKEKSAFVSPQDSKIWKLVQQYKIALNKSTINLEDINNFSYISFESPTVDGCTQLFPDLSFEKCIQSVLELSSGKDTINKLSEEKITVYENEKQGIIFQNEDGNQTKIFIIKNIKNEWKVLKIAYSVSSIIAKDQDYDGRSDEKENCSDNTFDFMNGKCVKTDLSKKDSDKDGWWDGIEVEAETDPNNINSYPYKI